MATARPAIKQKSLARGIRKELNHNWDLYLLILPVVLYFIIFCYYPMYGAQIAFRDYRATRGILGSEWVGLEHFRRFFTGAYVGRLFKNTFLISLYSLVFGFPMPIILAIMLNEIRCVWFKKTVQLVTYAPFFLSTVVMVGLLTNYLSLSGGLVNQIIEQFGGEPISFMMEPSMFKTIYVVSAYGRARDMAQ